MNVTKPIPTGQASNALEEESAVQVLQQLEEERGKLFTEADYQEMRSAVLDELAHGARMRPFTIFTFAIIALGLAALAVVGVVAIRESGDYTLLIVSSAALVATLYFFWSLTRGIRGDAFRTLDARLAELKELRATGLVTEDEFTKLQAHILMSRQRQSVGQQ